MNQEIDANSTSKLKISHSNKHETNTISGKIYIEIAKYNIVLRDGQVFVNGQSLELPIKKEDFEVRRITDLFVSIEGKCLEL